MKMSNQLQSNIQRLASSFASAIVSAIRTANLDEIVALSGGSAAPAREVRPAAHERARDARLPRRSKADIERELGRVVALLKASKRGMRAEEIRGQLKMQSKEMPRILKEGLTKRALKSKGRKRSTTYSV
jgi:hypothetical protein